MFIGAWKAKPAVQRHTGYRIRIRYKTAGIVGPRIAGEPYGFVAKTGGWLWGEGECCYDPGTGTTVTPRQDQNTSDWHILEGSLDTGSSDFLPNFYLVMENVNQRTACVDTVWIEEDLGGGSYGPNIVSNPWMAHHLYMEQRNSYAFDKLLELAEKRGIYLRPVIHEKNGWIFNPIDDNGNFTSEASNSHLYGNWRQPTNFRWLQQAWWRYLQARWRYSTHIHSWELLNEGDPWNSQHYTLADEFGKYIHQFAPNDHLVSTSNRHSFPKDGFWANPDYPDVDLPTFTATFGRAIASSPMPPRQPTMPACNTEPSNPVARANRSFVGRQVLSSAGVNPPRISSRMTPRASGYTTSFGVGSTAEA